MSWKDDLLFPALGMLLKGVLWTISRTRLPQSSGTIQVMGLSSPVEILRDRWGVAHIYGQNEKDVLFGQGFVHAQERLWQMDFTRRVVSGRLAEVLGEAAVPVDRVMRTLSLRVTAEAEESLLSGEIKDHLDAYVAGVNAWIDLARRKRKVPVEFLLLGYQPEDWRSADSLGWEKLMCWTLAANWQSEFYRGELTRRFGPGKIAEFEINIEKAWAVILDLGQALADGKQADATRPYTGPHAGEGVGSNNWVIHGSRTDTGKPLLANDMHLELTTPGIWFENHLVGGRFEVTGTSLPGCPLVIAGHNRRVAWGFTDSCPDAQDLFEEHLRKNALGEWEVEFRGEWQLAKVRKELIKIKGKPPVVEDVIVTSHGPIINLLFKDAFPDAPPFALRWTALEPDRSFQAIHDMAIAGDCHAFRHALRNFDNPSQNIVYADIDGNIAYTMNGRIPIREKGDGTIPAPGWTGDHEWLGYIPFDELPHLFNPPAGYIVTANNQVQRPDFPHFLGIDYLVSERAGRINEMILALEKIDIPYIKRMHYDQVAFSARILAKVLGGLQTNDPDLVPLVENMRTWDGRLGVDNATASVFEATIRHAITLLLEHHLGEMGLRIQGKGPFSGQWPEHSWEWFIHLLEEPHSPWFDLGHGEGRDDILLIALRKTVDTLTRRLGPVRRDWQWGRLHQVTFGHALGRQKLLGPAFNLGPFPIGGDGNTINASFTSFVDLEHSPMVGPPFRFIADMNDLDHCWGILAPGQSGHLASKHYKDGIDPWFKGEYHPMLFRREEVEKNLEGRLVLSPN